ncbi:hypothetical protein [Salsuginibacillus kocurii]|uniref:hypothetical protein n=1 Tax=Salsuginibacillus kocurii TaxID=427078 RepID=UPI0012EA180E|nr:hypothetical protein [Salsuginibacillus kocurii]
MKVLKKGAGGRHALPLRSDGLPVRSRPLPLRSDGLPVRSRPLPLRSDGLPVRSHALPLRSDDDGVWCHGSLVPRVAMLVRRHVLRVWCHEH